MDKGAGIDHQDVQGRSAIHLAAWRGDLEVFQALKKAGATIALTDHQGRSVLHHAAMGGSTDMVEELLADTNTSVLNKEDNDGWLPLHWACRNERNHDVVMRLTEKADDCWAQLATPREWTPEKLAVFHEAQGLIPSDKCTEEWKFGYCHWAFVCDGCDLEVSRVSEESQRSNMLTISQNQPIYGIRWRCKVCESFNFASNALGHANSLICMISRRCLRARGQKPSQCLGRGGASLREIYGPRGNSFLSRQRPFGAWAGRYRHAMTTCVRIAYLTKVLTKMSLYRGCPRLWHRLLFTLTTQRFRSKR